MEQIQGGFNASQAGSTMPRLDTGKIALLDADYMKYVITSRIFKYYQVHGSYPDVEKMIKDWAKEWFLLIGDPIIFTFSGKSAETFRAKIAFEKKYKGNRENTPDPYDYEKKVEHMYLCIEVIQKSYPTLLFKDLEADDIVSALQDKENTYIISKDKDLKQVAGHHYDWNSNTIYEITDGEAFMFLCTQLLTGDTTDNITGLKGVGPKNAEKILQGLRPTQAIRAVIGAYHNKLGLINGTDAFAENWFLVKMRNQRGTYFKGEYQRMFDLKEMVLNGIRINKNKES